MSPPKSEDELEKRLGGMLMRGEQVVNIDNVLPNEPLRGALLFSMLTQKRVSPRVLGTSEMLDLSSACLMLATGNLFQTEEDLIRRTVTSHLDAGVENPEMRDFDFDPVDRAKERRGELVVAAITVLRAFHLAGRPKMQPALGGFAQWSLLVRNALLWLGEADPVDSISAARETDPALLAIKSVYTQWSLTIGFKRVSGRQVIEAAAQQAGDFREVLMVATRQKVALSGLALGRWLATVEGRIVDGYRIEKMPPINGVATYQLVWERQPE